MEFVTGCERCPAFFANEQDEDGIRYASRILTWLELSAGDARQRETANDLYQSIIKAAKP